MSKLNWMAIYFATALTIGCSVFSRPLSEEEIRILVAVAPTASCFFWTRFDGVLVVDVDGKDIVPNQKTETIEAWLAAIDSLENRGYISNEGLKVGVFVLTNKGRAVGSRLAASKNLNSAHTHKRSVRSREVAT